MRSVADARVWVCAACRYYDVGRGEFLVASVVKFRNVEKALFARPFILSPDDWNLEKRGQC